MNSAVSRVVCWLRVISYSTTQWTGHCVHTGYNSARNLDPCSESKCSYLGSLGSSGNSDYLISLEAFSKPF